MKRLYTFIFWFMFTFTVFAGNDSTYIDQQFRSIKDSTGLMHQRRTFLAISGSVFYAGTITGLYIFDYKDNLQSHFRTYSSMNDWRMGMDATHHATATYHIGRLGYDLLRWAGNDEKHSTWIGGLTGFFLLSSQEILDGFDKKWGASVSDETANALGAALFISQQLMWHDQKIILKWSYHPTSFPDYRPDLLGSNSFQRMLKDYNGQTFWISANLKSFHRDSRLPQWLNIAVGFGITGATGPLNTPPLYRSIPVPEFERQRLFIISPDVDLTRIRTRSKALKWIFEAIGFLKFPLPALELRNHGAKFKPLYF